MTRPGSLEALAEFILDVLSYDVAEQVVNIKNMLNDTGSVGWRLNWTADFTDPEIVQALKWLVNEQLVSVWQEIDGELQENRRPEDRPGSWMEYWYGLTNLGRKRLDEWTPPERVGYDELE